MKTITALVAMFAAVQPAHGAPVASSEASATISKAVADAKCRPGEQDEGPGADWTGGLHPTAGGLTPVSIPGAIRITPFELNCLAGQYGNAIKLITPISDAQLLPLSYRVPGGGAGGSFDDAHQTAVEQRLQELTGGNRDAPLITYCHHYKCFLSYNLALRAVHAGYRNVYWLRTGIAGYTAIGGNLVAGDWDTVVKKREAELAAEEIKRREDEIAANNQEQKRIADQLALPLPPFGREYLVTLSNSRLQDPKAHIYSHDLRLSGKRGDRFRITTRASEGAPPVGRFLTNIRTGELVDSGKTGSSDGTVFASKQFIEFTLPEDGDYFYPIQDQDFQATGTDGLKAVDPKPYYVLVERVR